MHPLSKKNYKFISKIGILFFGLVVMTSYTTVAFASHNLFHGNSSGGSNTSNNNSSSGGGYTSIADMFDGGGPGQSGANYCSTPCGGPGQPSGDSSSGSNSSTNTQTVDIPGSSFDAVRSNTSQGGSFVQTVTVGGQTFNIYNTTPQTGNSGVPVRPTYVAVPVSGGNNSSGGSGTTPPTSSCSRGGPNLVVEDIFFVRSRAATSSAVNQNELELGLTYDAIAQIRNLGCDSTASPGKFLNLMPFGRNGGFPTRTWIDFGNNTSNELNIVVNNVGPVAGNATIFVRFSDIVMTTPGAHGMGSVADMTNLAASCPGGGGCIIEPNDPRGNVLTETFRVIRPSITIGSFLMPDANSVTGANTSAVRTVPPAAQVGLYWTGNLVNFASCTGSTTASNGTRLNDFSGQRDLGTLSAAAQLQLPTTGDHVDAVLTEPATAGLSHTYTISCRTIAGTTVTDSIQLVTQAGQGCWMDNVANAAATCGTICAVVGGVPAADSNGARCMSGESRQSGGILALGNGIPNPFQWGCMGACVPQGLIPTTQVGNYCYRAGIPQDSNPSDLSVGCYCRVGATSTIASNRCTATPVVPVVPTECSDAVDNDNDRLVDALDPGCWTDPTDPTTYNPNDTTERTFVTLVPTVSNLTLKTGERLTSVPFTTRNTGVMPVTEYKYIITIGGQSRPEVTRQAALGATQTDTPPSTVSYTAPGTASTVPVRVCVSHPDMATAACDTANITIEAYQCNDGRDNDRDGRIDNRSNLEDPGCYTNPYVLTNANYDPTDDDESNGTIVVPQPTELSISGNPQVVRYDTKADLTYRINSTIPLNCTLAGPGVATTIISYSGSAVGTLVSRTVPSTTLKSAQSFTINCRPPVIPGVTTPAFTRTTLVEVIPKVQEI